MMKALVFLIFFLINLQSDSIKSGVDITQILQQIDTISEKIRQKQMENARLMQQQQINPVHSIENQEKSEEQKKEEEIRKQEQELQLKEKELELLQRKEEYQKRLEALTKTQRSVLEKRSRAMEALLLNKLYQLKQKLKYEISVKQYIKIGNQDYAYLTQNRLEEAKNYIAKVTKDIEDIKSNLRALRDAKMEGRDKWIQVLANLENRMEDRPENFQVAVASQNMIETPPSSKANFIKVKKGDSFGTIKVYRVTENKVVIGPAYWR